MDSTQAISPENALVQLATRFKEILELLRSASEDARPLGNSAPGHDFGAYSELHQAYLSIESDEAITAIQMFELRLRILSLLAQKIVADEYGNYAEFKSTFEAYFEKLRADVLAILEGLRQFNDSSPSELLSRFLTKDWDIEAPLLAG